MLEQREFSRRTAELDNPSDLITKSIEKLDSLLLEPVRSTGIWRTRDAYFLNISYPSMQAMPEVTPEDVYPKEKQKEGKRVALYGHIPFCQGQCSYCHYYKEFGRPPEEVDDYLQALSQELAMHEENFGGIQAESVYIGGGTPSYMTASQINRLFRTIKQHVEIEEGAEISFEIHPESGTKDRLMVLAEHGVNRISIGVESFNDKILLRENRRHTVAEAVEVFKRTADVFDNINLDLVYGLRRQTLEDWEESLDWLAQLQPASATLYFARLKQGTPEFNLWQKHPETFASDEELLLMHIMNFEWMEEELGYIQNPVDWFIRGRDFFHTYQDHNWRRTDEIELLGLGSSAYSYVNGYQYYNVNDTLRYKAEIQEGKLPIWRGESLEGEERMRRTIMLGIKMGINRSDFERTYGIDVVEQFSGEWERLENLGLVTIDSEGVELSYMGKLFADEVGQQFYSEEMKRRMLAIDPTLVSTTWPRFNP